MDSGKSLSSEAIQAREIFYKFLKLMISNLFSVSIDYFFSDTGGADSEGHASEGSGSPLEEKDPAQMAAGMQTVWRSLFELKSV